MAESIESQHFKDRDPQQLPTVTEATVTRLHSRIIDEGLHPVLDDFEATQRASLDVYEGISQLVSGDTPRTYALARTSSSITYGLLMMQSEYEGSPLPAHPESSDESVADIKSEFSIFGREHMLEEFETEIMAVNPGLFQGVASVVLHLNVSEEEATAMRRAMAMTHEVLRRKALGI